MAEQRLHDRHPFEGRIFIELRAGGLTSDERSQIAVCRVTDISTSGFRANLDLEVTVGAILHIGVDFFGAEDTLYLAAEVMWSRSTGDAESPWTAGFKLYNASDSDIETWRAMIADMEGR